MISLRTSKQRGGSWQLRATEGACILCLLFCGSLSHAQTSRPVAVSAAAAAALGKYEHDSIAHPSASGEFGGLRSSSAAVPISENSLDIRRVALALGIVLGLVFAVQWAMRWIFPTANVARSSQVMKVLSRSVIAPKQQLLLVQIGRRLVVVGDCGTQMNALAEITDPDEVASLVGQLRSEPLRDSAKNSAGDAPSMFGPLLGKARQRFDAVPPVGEESAAASDEDSLVETRSELSGLSEKIRMLSQHLGKT